MTKEKLKEKMKSNLTIFLLLILTTISYQQIRLIVNSPEVVKNTVGNDTMLKVIMWGKQETMEDLTTLAKLASPADGCEPYVNSLTENDNGERFAYFVKSGGRCSLSTLIHNAQVSKAVALIIEHDANDLSQIEVPDHMSGKLFDASYTPRRPHPCAYRPKEKNRLDSRSL